MAIKLGPKNQNSFKLFTAIEIVFIIFILVVVVLIVIQMVTKYVNPQRISPFVESAEKLAKYNEMKKYCDDLCNNIRTASNDRDRIAAMVDWCIAQITDKGKNYIDLVEDGVRGFVVIRGEPYCEDGLYCFNLFSCDVGIRLDMKECRRILCEYYVNVLGESTLRASKYIKQELIKPGTCSLSSDVLGGRKPLYNTSKWWHQKLFNITIKDKNGNTIQVEDFCAKVLYGEDIEGIVGNEEGEDNEEENGNEEGDGSGLFPPPE